jgi:hypothetical protein
MVIISDRRILPRKSVARFSISCGASLPRGCYASAFSK